jgi:predicted short-subunit dehydrogenase-like oxidoreductase (DUF2520 family)
VSLAPDPPRFRVGLVGAGRAGLPLAAALAAAGHRVVAVNANSDKARRRTRMQLPDASITSALAVAEMSELLLLAVPDDALAPLVRGLATTGALHRGQFLVHASGRYGVRVLDPATEAGALPLALHPVMTFAGTPADVTRLLGCPFGITAPEVLRPVAEALVLEMGGEPVWVAEEQRLLYHAALAHGANHLVALVAQTLDLLAAAGIDDPAALVSALLPTALDNVLRLGDRALTGPVARGDVGTVAAHVRELSLVSPSARAAYVALARVTADRALAAELISPVMAEPLLEALRGSGFLPQ